MPVRRVHHVTPRMVRITLGSDELVDFVHDGTDQNVMLYFYDDAVELPEPLTLESARGMWSRVRPTIRSYTIARHDPDANEIDIDFVLHGDGGHGGPASAWAAAAKPGDQLIFVGPSPAYRPDPDADLYLLAGDETALPAIGVTLRGLPAGARARVFVEVDNAADELPLPTDADAEITWLHRDGVPPQDSELLVNAITAATLDGVVDAWIGAERAPVLAVRRHLLDERRLDRKHVRATTYWRAGQEGT
ncbi:NADPH-dependent ferric siderophore reductase [Herbihabitans rhizosphaerae]|uniref:NADPH-dependent ferric siderophore reductase n=1 Tax=Herbihabitans rhizosphaerae TaxID=1872711 RepID=A0A4V2ETE0_9PSEU|nr:NADPH-dependent ferric siderophore reductase [Herbihabitans rhizosphaerae]